MGTRYSRASPFSLPQAQKIDMPRKPFWQADKAAITTPAPLERTLRGAGTPRSQSPGAQSVTRHTPLKASRVNNRLSFSENLSQLYELWDAQRAELQASAEPLPKRIEALGRLARVLPQLQVAERLHKAKRGEKAIEEMSDAELQAMLSKELTDSEESNE